MYRCSNAEELKELFLDYQERMFTENKEPKEAQRWRKVSEELPEEKTIVLCIMVHYGYIGYHYGLNYRIDGKWAKDENPTYWMPLPKSPKEVK